MSTYNQSLVDDMMAGTQRPLVGPQALLDQPALLADPSNMMQTNSREFTDGQMPLDTPGAVDQPPPLPLDTPGAVDNPPPAGMFPDANNNGIDDRLEVEHTITRDNTGMRTQKTVFRGTVPLGISAATNEYTFKEDGEDPVRSWLSAADEKFNRIMASRGGSSYTGRQGTNVVNAADAQRATAERNRNALALLQAPSAAFAAGESGAAPTPMDLEAGKWFEAGREEQNRKARLAESQANRKLHEDAQNEIAAGRMTARGYQAGLSGAAVPDNPTEGDVKGHAYGTQMKLHVEQSATTAAQKQREAELFAEDKKISDSLYQTYKADIDAGKPVTTTVNGTQFYLMRQAHEKGLLWRWSPVNPMGLGAQMGQLVQGQASSAAVPPATPRQAASDGAAALPIVADQAGFDALPSGTVFLTPKGQKRTKP